MLTDGGVRGSGDGNVFLGGVIKHSIPFLEFDDTVYIMKPSYVVALFAVSKVRKAILAGALGFTGFDGLLELKSCRCILFGGRGLESLNCFSKGIDHTLLL